MQCCKYISNVVNIFWSPNENEIVALGCWSAIWSENKVPYSFIAFINFSAMFTYYLQTFQCLLLSLSFPLAFTHAFSLSRIPILPFFALLVPIFPAVVQHFSHYILRSLNEPDIGILWLASQTCPIFIKFCSNC